MKELHQNVLQEGLFTSIKGHLYKVKGHLGKPEAQVEFEPPNRKLFLISFICIKKKNFSKRAVLTKYPTHGCFIFL